MTSFPRTSGRSLRLAAVASLAVAASALPAHAQLGPETYKATATLKTPGGASVTAPVVISIDRWTTDEERDKAVMGLKAGGTPAVQNLLAAMPDAGMLKLGRVQTPIRFARSLPVAGGKVVTLVTAQPVYYVGAGLPGATNPADKAGYSVAVVIFQVDADGNGDTGDLAPAAKVKLDDKSGFVVEDYGAEAVRLTSIAKTTAAKK